MISRRALEITATALTGAFGVAVIVSSLEVGAGWSAGGVGAGTFPFITGTLVCAGSLVNLARALVGGHATVIGPSELRRLAGLFLPALAYVAAIPVVGLLVASAAYVIGTMSLQHRMPLWRSLLIAGATVLTLYVLFERTFQVMLPRGTLGAALGF